MSRLILYPAQPAAQLGEATATVAKVASAGATAASVVAATVSSAKLTALGIGAQAIPVAGQVLGAIAIVAGFLARGRAKAKAIKAERKLVEEQNNELKVLSVELDYNIAQAAAKQNEIVAELQRLGITINSGVNGLDGIGTWFKKTFAPGAYEKGLLKNAQNENATLQSQVENKINVLENMKNDLQRLYDTLTRGVTNQNLILYGGISAVVLGLLFILLNSDKK